MTFRFADPWLLLLALPALAVLLLRLRRGGAEFAAFALARQVLPVSRGPWLYRALIASAIVAGAVALARPQYGRTIVEREQAGRDLMLVIDLSGSMQIDDLSDTRGERCDRLAAVMTAAKKFIAGRANDRIGLVFFAGTALTSCPLTYDHATVEEFLTRTEEQQRQMWNSDDRRERVGLLADGTNLGLGIGTAVRGMKDLKAKGRAIILITDGCDTPGVAGWIDPLAAARHAANTKITVHGIAVGNPKGTLTIHDPFGRVKLIRVPQDQLPDLGRLTAITTLADGMAFTASDSAGLNQVFARIDKLEPSPQVVREREDFTDRFALPLTLAAAALALALLAEPLLRGVA